MFNASAGAVGGLFDKEAASRIEALAANIRQAVNSTPAQASVDKGLQTLMAWMGNRGKASG